MTSGVANRAPLKYVVYLTHLGSMNSRPVVIMRIYTTLLFDNLTADNGMSEEEANKAHKAYLLQSIDVFSSADVWSLAVIEQKPFRFAACYSQ